MINIKLVFPSPKGCCHESHFVGFIPEVDVAGHRQLVAQPGRGVTLGFAVHLVIGSLLSASMPGCVEAELEHERTNEHDCILLYFFHIRILSILHSLCNTD